jgi:hypothetical protein
VTTDQLWGAAFLALGVFEGWRIYRSVDTGRWTLSYIAKVSFARVAHPISFWACVTLNVLAMIALLFLGAYIIAPLTLLIIGK